MNVKTKLTLTTIIIYIIILVMPYMALAQKNSISGKVTDKDGTAIPGVSIIIKGTTMGTITNIDGNFTLEVDNANDGILVFSFIGMKTKMIPIAGKNLLDVKMEEDVLGLEEVIVVGYGTQAKKDVTGSVSVVNSQEMESRPNTQVGLLIQGKAAGVKVLSSSGKPSQGFSIRIRGTNSINAGSEPLYIVDGIPTTDTRSINPSDIENITILKDASSAAIYGAQGANGVVIISTKRGTTNKPKVTIDSYTGYSQVWKKLDVLNGEQYRELMTELGRETDWDLYNKNTNWQDEIFQKGVSNNLQVSLAGKSDKTNYYLSGGYMKQVGAVRSAEMTRKNFKINLEQEVAERIKIGSRIAYTLYHDVDVTDNTSVNSGGVLLGALTTPPIIGIYNDDGTFTSNPFQNWENPIASTDGSQRDYDKDRILGNVYTEISILKTLKFRSSFGIDNSNSVYNYFLDPYRTSYGRALVGRGQNSKDKSYYYIAENTLNFSADFQNHKIEAMVGTVQQKFFWENSNIVRQNFASDLIPTVNGGAEIIEATDTKSEKANSSFIGRLNYSYNDKYLFTSNFRNDGSTIFGPNHEWGLFPSFSLGWRISKESFMESVSLVNDLKLRAGWGVVGNDQFANYAYLGTIGTGANYPFGGQIMPGTYPASIENLKLKWEESKQTNLGIDLTLLDSRITFVADAYIKNIYDLLLDAPLPHSTGYESARQNVGKLQNKGLEFSLSTININSDIKWTTDFNISFNKNKVIDLVGPNIPAANITSRGDAVLVREDHSLGEFYGYRYGGVDPANGNVYYINQAGESTFTPTPDDRVVIGNANPKFIYGFTNTVSYKGVTLLVFLEGSKGNDMLNATRFETEGMTDPKNQTTTVLRRWKQAGDVTDVPRSRWGSTNNSRISDHFIEDGSYLRFKTVTLSYDLPSQLLDKVKIENLKLYFTGENLLTFTKYSGFDPEVNAYGTSNLAQGIDFGTYPQTRNIIFGLTVTF